MEPKLEAFHVEQEGDAIIVIPQGDSHKFRYDALHYEYNELHRRLENPGAKNLVVDLGNVEILGSLMLGVFVKLARKVTAAGGRVILCNASESMRKILELQNLLQVWPLFDNRAQAMQSLIGLPGAAAQS